LKTLNYKEKKFIWGAHNDYYGNLFLKRATGHLPEMESSKALAKIVAQYIKNNDNILDAGCGVGHYLRSLDKLIKKNFIYTGFDATAKYIDIAKKIFLNKKGVPARKQSIYFEKKNIERIRSVKKKYDITFCCNVLLHLHNPKKAIKNLLKITKRVLIIRTLISEKNYIVKELNKDSKLKDLDKNLNSEKFIYYNLFTKNQIKHWLVNNNKHIKLKIFPDRDFNVKNINQKKEFIKNFNQNTTVIDNKQMNGPIMLPWHFIICKII
jgi:2-polyprenyl-3-methyl-5-hydroxy-6-metoxy-1,4-benzoquinol methylase